MECDVDSDLDSSCRDLEDYAMRSGLTLDLSACERLGVGEDFITEWALGVELLGAADVGHFDKGDYATITQNYERASEE